MRSLIFIFMILFTSACKKNKSLNTPFNAQDCAGSVGIAWTIAIGHNQKPLQNAGATAILIDIWPCAI